jgi:dethiobiotin synthetase
MQPIFIAGIGTNIGKTVVAAILTEALNASYWKPIQAGFDTGSDTDWVGARISHPKGRLFSETYKLLLPASPHIAARSEEVTISLDRIVAQFDAIRGGTALPISPGPLPSIIGCAPTEYLVIEGAGGLLVPLNDHQFILDLIKELGAPVILVSRNYLGSINHSLLTAATCRASGLPIAGWIFNDQYLHYEEEIAEWSGIPAIASIPFQQTLGPEFIRQQAHRIRPSLLAALGRPFQDQPRTR